MSKKATEKTGIQKTGIGLFVLAMLIFTGSLAMSRFELDVQALREQLQLNVSGKMKEQYGLTDDYYLNLAGESLTALEGKSYATSFAFKNALQPVLKELQEAVRQDLKEEKGLTTSDGDYWSLVLQDYRISNVYFPVAKASSTGFLPRNAGWVFALSLLLGIGGAMMYILPKSRFLPGIKNDHIYHSKMHNRGWLGIFMAVYFTGFYIVLYFYPEHMVNWVIILDPLAEALRGSPADQWFVYGFLYTMAILIMGVRMIIKYRHSRYHIVRTFSVMFFQTAFAFLIPQILALLNEPVMDFKNIWPLNYDFFFDYRINEMIEAGTFGLFMLFWGTALAVIGVPLITYFYGKRWYCSWVCGCGGLAETLGDPYRQLSDKSLTGWQIERWMVHGVLVFAVLMTGVVLYAYFTGDTLSLNINRWLILALIWGGGMVFYVFHYRLFPTVPRWRLRNIIGVVGGIATVGLVAGYLGNNSASLNFSSYQLRSWYGFYIGAGFSGVLGVGLYPLLGNRPWCRFGCPLAAYLGIVQRFKSRFRITANGGQCISCGNCSTYCEMGIDVRWYAQRGQDVIRASCVGCGICAAVCPRGVLRLENSSADVNTRAQEQRALHITKEDVELVG
jgi:ferredoxin-type protein NapH